MITKRLAALAPFRLANIQIRRASGNAAIESQVPMPAITRPAASGQQQAPVATPSGRKPPSDAGLAFTAAFLLFFTPPAVVYWWNHRSEHMGKKKEAMLQEIAQKRKEFEEYREAQRKEKAK